jgi:hypothetical protein
MTSKETVALNFFPSDMEVSSQLTEHEMNTLLKSIYRALTKYVASKGFAIFPYRPGIRFFADHNRSIDIAGREHHLVHVEEWSGKINEIRFHDGFMAQVELIEGKIWLKIDPRQQVLVKGNEQTISDYNRSFYVSYCPFSDCENRSQCLLARPKSFRVKAISRSKEKAIQLKENLEYGCKFFTIVKGKGDIIETEFRRKPLLIPQGMVYYKGAITDMPHFNLIKLYQKRCLLKSEERLALTQYAFSVLTDGRDSFNIMNRRNNVHMSFGNMFQGAVEL